MQRAFYRSERIEASFKASFCDLGNAELRIYSVVEGESPFSADLADSGEGLHHLALQVSDLDRSLAEFAALGIEASWVAREIGFAHLNTKTIGGMSFALHARSFG